MADQRDDDQPAKAGQAPGLVTETETVTDERRMYLDGGRQVAVVEHAGQQAVEIRAASGQLELRIKLTAEGPVLSLDGVKVEMNAAESLQIKCKDFKVEATESTTIESKGELKIKSDGEMELDSPSDVRIKGKKIWLN
ncbi:MAG TPA: hypothetical protein PLF40_29330 [Kofleriaceae bacterium]|nr:hypothetical protein [Kofleriaceae bacterium]